MLTEPDVGSDPARLASTATPIDDGQAYELDGVKLWTTNGVVAELLVIMARVPKSEGRRGGISAFVVEADSPGITVERRNKFMGLRGIENGVTRLHRVRVPRENLIGSEGDGLKIALTTLNAGRLSIPASATGSSKWALKIAREWSGERVQWGKPLAEHEAVARKLSFIAATVYALDAVLELSAQMADEGRNDIRIEAALAKLWSSEMACVIADEVMQIRGGRGYETAESLAARGERAVPVEQALRDLRINRIFEGSSEIMRLLIAREAVDAHLAAAGDLAKPDTGLRQKAAAAVGASGFYAKWLPQLVFGEGQRPRAYHEFGPLAAHLRFIERSSRKLARNTFYGMARWQAKLEQRQGFLGRVVDIGAELFAMSAACVHAESQRAADPVVGQQAYELAEAFCAQATLRVEALFRGLWDNTDASDVQLTRNLLQGRYGWLEAGIIDQSEGTGPWIAHWEEGESTEANLARRFSSGDRSATSPR
ncbi:acyl-CoA dehydrogenase, C-terminal domain protein [Mycobacterium intracellulare 1956]|uniref:Acyl-CoA dehydrogenase, C-terminal domain protein n=1 Tax=Mycobacterium intracellulare 1956 TaxID=1299331 RepID=X8CMF8_MYCIT|nr:acyl-CoA dehydrogenase, C-terminal domain protein [Mycobacterium intracellulare 1956]